MELISKEILKFDLVIKGVVYVFSKGTTQIWYGIEGIG